MPYKYEIEKMKIPRVLDRRVKITEEKRAEIKTLYHIIGLAQREISRRVKVSRRAISFILFPARLAIYKAQYKERRKDGRYYSRAKHTLAMRSHRQYKWNIKDKLI